MQLKCLRLHESALSSGQTALNTVTMKAKFGFIFDRDIEYL